MNLFAFCRSFLVRRKLIACYVVGVSSVLLQSCVSVNPLQSNQASGSGGLLPPGYFLPKTAFSGPSVTEIPAVNAPRTARTSDEATDALEVLPASRIPMVWLYASPSTRHYFSTGGLDSKVNTGVWEVFLRKYKIPYKLVSSVELLEATQPGVLLLPSSVALSDRERQAVVGFRAKGGGVLASWLTGVRSENGEWRGLDFMARALDVAVVGTTEGEDEDTFLMPYGNSPVTHSLQAGVRIWLERLKEWYPLRLVGRHPAAQMMDWSRTSGSGKPGSVIVFDERRQPTGVLSRSVVLGYSERTWLSADPKLVEAIAHNALLWLLRQPDAYLSAWPHPFASAFVLAVEGVDNFGPVDLAFARMLEEAGAKATYFVSSGNVSKSLEIIKTLMSRGHELAYFGNSFEGFRDQTAAVQSRRLVTMRQTMSGFGLPIAATAGFRAPMDSYDKTTQKLLLELGFGYHVAFMDVSDSRLPFVATNPVANSGQSLVVLPRTQQGPEESLEQGDPDDGLKRFFHELDISRQMGGLSVVPVPNQSILTPEQLGEISGYLKDQHGRMWMGTATQVAHWWHERERIGVRLEAGLHAPQLTVSILGDRPMSAAASIWINLPEQGDKLRLVGKSGKFRIPKIADVDAWRSAIVLDQFPAGEHQWELHFDKPGSIGSRP